MASKRLISHGRLGGFCRRERLHASLLDDSQGILQQSCGDGSGLCTFECSMFVNDECRIVGWAAEKKSLGTSRVRKYAK